MSMYYKLRKIKSSIEAMSGKVYADSVSSGTITTAEIGQLVEDNSTAKYADVMAVLREMAYQFRICFGFGMGVTVDGLGSFIPQAASKCVDSIEEFNASTDMRKVKVRFIEQYSMAKDSEGKSYKIPSLTSGIKLREAPQVSQ